MGPNIKPFPIGKELQDSIARKVILKTGDNITTDDICPSNAALLPFRSNIPKLKVDKDGILPLHVPYVQCDNCESPISLKEEMVLDLTQEFKNIYDTERFISNYKIYRNSNFKSIKEAYISGEYGKITKLSYKEDSSFSYEAYICRPTVQKQLLIKSNNELIAYRSMANSFTKRASYLRKTMPNIDDLINYLSSHSYAQFKGDVDYINKNGINLSDPNISDENKLLKRIYTDRNVGCGCRDWNFDGSWNGTELE